MFLVVLSIQDKLLNIGCKTLQGLDNFFLFRFVLYKFRLLTSQLFIFLHPALCMETNKCGPHMASGWVWQVDNASRRSEWGMAVRVVIYVAGFLTAGSHFYQVKLSLWTQVTASYPCPFLSRRGTSPLWLTVLESLLGFNISCLLTCK